MNTDFIYVFIRRGKSYHLATYDYELANWIRLFVERLYIAFWSASFIMIGIYLPNLSLKRTGWFLSYFQILVRYKSQGIRCQFSPFYYMYLVKPVYWKYVYLYGIRLVYYVNKSACVGELYIILMHIRISRWHTLCTNDNYHSHASRQVCFLHVCVMGFFHWSWL